MGPLGLLKCLGKALVRHVGNAIGFDNAGDLAVGVREEVWGEWQREKNEQQRRDEVAAILQMAAQELRRQVAEVVREVAAGQPPEVQERVSRWLEALPDKLAQLPQHTPEKGAESGPFAVRLQDAGDMSSLLSGPRPAPPSRVTLTLIAGDGKTRELVFEERTTCLLGRDKGCQPGIPRDKKYQTVSRHHVLLDVNPPAVIARDLASLAGTYVNGELIGKRPEGMDRDESRGLVLPERPLKDGDEIRLGKSGAPAFRVRITAPTLCADCGAWIPDDRKAGAERAAGVFQCAPCRARAAAATHPRPGRSCARCGRDSGAVGAGQLGDVLCAACRKDPEQLVQDLQGQTRAGGSALVAIQGYTILKELGRGGMGSVWLARHDRTGRQVAVKVMLPQVAATERAVQRFLSEISNTRILNHPNVVRLGDAGYSRGTFFMTLDYCEGGSVAGLMQQRGGTLPLDEAVEIILQALEGLHYAHNVFGPGSGLVHRDVKPANLFLSGAGSARVARVGDYGLSKAFDDAGLSGATRTGETAGTPHFIARQQVIDFKCAEPEVDVWALAAALYNMLTGAVPRDFPMGRDPWLVVLETPAVPIRRRKSSLPKKLADVIDLALVEEPEIRFKTAAEFKEALESAL